MAKSIQKINGIQNGILWNSYYKQEKVKRTRPQCPVKYMGRGTTE